MDKIKTIESIRFGSLDCLNFSLIDDEGIYINCAVGGKDTQNAF